MRRERDRRDSPRNFYVSQSRDFRVRTIRVGDGGRKNGLLRRSWQKQCPVLESNAGPRFVLRAFLRGNGAGRIVEHCASRKQQLVVDGRCYLPPFRRRTRSRVGGGYSQFVVLKRIRNGQREGVARCGAIDNCFPCRYETLINYAGDGHSCASPRHSVFPFAN